MATTLSDIEQKRNAYQAKKKAELKQFKAQMKIEKVRHFAHKIAEVDKKYKSMTVAELMKLPDVDSYAPQANK
jgi:hypothetical protein